MFYLNIFKENKNINFYYKLIIKNIVKFKYFIYYLFIYCYNLICQIMKMKFYFQMKMICQL